MKDVYDSIIRQIYIPSSESFSSTFYAHGFQDGRNQPYKFKEIEWIKFPSQWTIPREMRSEKLELQSFKQDINKIMMSLNAIGKLEIDFDEEELIIYGYK
ncbi:hypothetical protein [Leptospira interrogans]|uniref:hypothetical protein n=1 Tax=Leptospira interrogans TaxID=173 RepID=UPI00177CED5D|nr:hypothetical protein [Leptospira interrogans]MBE0301968.1 hypothetical protein [Leptospira interrogans serovar Yeoncheon]